MRTRRDLLERYAEQIDWMRASAERFDAGVESEAKRIATIIRTLVHNTAISTSLLSQLGIQNEMQWWSTVPSVEQGDAPGTGGLWVSVPHEPGYRPIKGKYPYPLTFDAWWSDPVVRTTVGAYCRSDFILHSVNFDGGAHIDPELPAAYESLSRNGGFRPARINSVGQSYSDSSDPIPSAIRTIAGELYISVNQHDWP